MLTLVGEYFSPWTEKARWALDHHGVDYAYREHLPLVGEPLLRLRTRRRVGRVSVPLLLTDDGPIPDSFAIARHAERVGRGPLLFPADRADAIEAWNARSERALAASRVLYLERVAKDREAKAEMQPGFVPMIVRRASVPLADLAIAFLKSKYGVDDAAERAAEAALVAELEALRDGLARGGGRYLEGGRFTYADVTMAVVLQFVAPPGGDHLALGPATRAACHAPAIAARFADVAAWRDGLYAAHRRAR